MIREGIQKLVESIDLTHDESQNIMKDILSGVATEAQIGAFLTALRMKGETIQEISAFARTMREFCTRIHPRVNGRLVDTCGTGGDQIKTFNISTISAFVVAGAGVSIAKHGNRAVTSKSGSADVLEKLGLNLDLYPKDVERVIEEVGIGFMFAPAFQPAMKYALGPRREIGIRTVFNVLGPLTNPAGANAQVLGVYDEKWLKPLAHVLKDLGSEEAMVVHGADGLDEISILGKTLIVWLRDQGISLLEITPKDFGFRTVKPEEIGGAAPEQSAELAFKILNGILKPHDPRRDAVLLNAAAGIVVGSKADKLVEGIALADESIESGSAYKKLKMMIEMCHGEIAKLEELERKYD